MSFPNILTLKLGMRMERGQITSFTDTLQFRFTDRKRIIYSLPPGNCLRIKTTHTCSTSLKTHINKHK